MKYECQCFLCKHKDKPKLLNAYYNGYKDACEVFLKWKDKNSLYTIIKSNYDETINLMNEREGKNE